jgi:hypothetical protein
MVFIAVLSVGYSVSVHFLALERQELEKVKKELSVSRDSLLLAEGKLIQQRQKTDTLISEKQNEIESLETGINKVKRSNYTLKQRADSAQDRYLREKTIQRCDSALNEKNSLLAGKDAEIDSLDKYAREYEDLALLFQSKAEINDSLYQKYKGEYDKCYNAFSKIVPPKKETFWDKNKAVITFIAGAGIMYIIK